MRSLHVRPANAADPFDEEAEELSLQSRREAYRVGQDGETLHVTRARVHGVVSRTRYRAGSQDVTLFPRLGVPGVLYYPADSEGEPLPAPGQGWPAVVFVHGITPGGGVINPPLFRRWASYQEALAQSGFVSLALEFGTAPSGVRVGNAVEWLREGEGASILTVNPARLALVGHSAGAAAIADRDDVIDPEQPRALVLLGPNPELVPALPPKSLTIGSYTEVNGRPDTVYLTASTPKHLLVFRDSGYSHFAYFDGFEADGSQRATTLLGLRRFLDRYLRSAPVRDDLDLTADPEAETPLRNICSNVGRGDVCIEPFPP